MTLSLSLMNTTFIDRRLSSFPQPCVALGARALIGLTATPDPADEDKVIYRYTLGEAIADELVKIPVIVYRKDGHNDMRTSSLTLAIS